MLLGFDILSMQSVVVKESTMRYIDIIQSSIDYIEDNLKTEITAEELSANAGFSVYHYYRIFQNVVGMSIKQYITRRRLLWAAYEIANGKKQVEAALDYGFDTSAGFYKAFRGEFGCSPSEYVRRFKIRKPYHIYLLQEDSIMIANSKIKSILRNWDLNDPVIQNIVTTDDGSVRENAFYIGDDYVLKVFSSLGKVNNNVAILTALNNVGFPSGAPIKTKKTENFASDGELYYMLTPRIKGTKFDVEKLFGRDAVEASRYLGQIIGKLHLALKANDDIVCNERDIFREVCDEWLAPAAAVMGLPDSFCQDYKNTFGKLHENLPVQIIHRDPNPSNIIMSDGTVAGFIDFDLSQRSIRLFDPCYAATAVLFELFSSQNCERYSQWVNVFRGIILGYDDVAHLTADEKKALPYVVLSIQLICVGYFSAYEKFTDLAQTNKEMLRWLISRLKELDFLT